MPILQFKGGNQPPPNFLIPSHWGVRFQHTNFGKQPISCFCFSKMRCPESGNQSFAQLRWGGRRREGCLALSSLGIYVWSLLPSWLLFSASHHILIWPCPCGPQGYSAHVLSLHPCEPSEKAWEKESACCRDRTPFTALSHSAP